MLDKKRIRIMDVPVDFVDAKEAMSIVEGLMETPGCSQIVTPNSEIVMGATKDKELKRIIESADLIVPDGIGLVYASRIIGAPLEERVTGIDLLDDILHYLEKTGQSVYFLGSKPADDTRPAVAEMAAEKMKEKYKNLKIVGTHHGYFKEPDEAAIVDEINNSGADFLCVALGSPKQERFISKYKQQLVAKCAIGVGGSLDVWAGTLKRAPEFYRNNGLEWLYRFKQEPSRYKRMATLPVFMLRIIFNKIRGGK